MDADTEGNLGIMHGAEGNCISKCAEISRVAISDDGVADVEPEIGVISPIALYNAANIQCEIIFGEAAANGGAVLGKVNETGTRLEKYSDIAVSIAGFYSE